MHNRLPPYKMATVIDGRKTATTFKEVHDQQFHILTIRRIAICLTITESDAKITFHTPTTYFGSGTSDVSLPRQFTSGQSIAWGSRKTAGPCATGTVGVFTYNSSDGNTLAVMWSLPFDFVIYKSWWNVKMFRGTRTANEDIYSEMYRTAQYKGNNDWHGPTDIGQGYTMTGTMAPSSVTSLEIEVTKTNQPNPRNDAEEENSV